ncbi:TPA: beta-ketoacyl-[acyl-carrier-protein] synthase family protein [Bacillus pseudomycoides]|nr:beta-ketoacyl-[acyl-carrier-protein] synthase family protein [Bacillus pseudomycoides]
MWEVDIRVLSPRVVVTGIGLIAGNGNNKDEFFENCCNGVSGLKKCSLFDASIFSTEYVGQIEEEFPYLTELPSDKERIQLIIEKCLVEMMKDSNLTKEYISKLGNKAYLSFATSLGNNGKIMQYMKSKLKGKLEPEWLIQIPSLLPWIKDFIGIEGGCYTTTTACAASTTSVGIALDLIKSKKASLVVVGGADPLSEFSCYGFNSLRALTKSVCKPFDEERDGINIGEGGAFLVLESLESAKERNAKIYAEVLGYGINNDAYHITSPDPKGEGAFLSMNMAIADSNKELESIDYINVHGTGTVLNDKMELRAIQNLFQDTNKKVLVSSTKSLIGHCLAAAGVIELAVTILSIHKGICIKNMNLYNGMNGYENIELLKENKNIKIRTALSNNFAFAGNTASILVGSYCE